MQTVPVNPFARPDTFFGVCQAIGDDFGFNPFWLRAAFAAFLFYSPLAMAATYFGLGLVVLATRLLFPNPRAAAQPEAETQAAAPAPAMTAPLPLAA